jgi:asparagine synthase (glutamine-hydrolysing)
VGYNWINQLIAYCASQVTDEQLAGAIAISVQFPITKEAYFYRSVFNKHYPQVSAAQTEVDSKMARKSRSKRKSK